MKKSFRQILSVLMTIILFLSAMPMILTAKVNAAESEDRTVFSLNAVRETENEFVVCFKLEEGAFSSLDFGITYDDTKFVSCTRIETIAADDFVAISNDVTGLFSGACATGWSEKGSVIATYTYEKKPGARPDKDDLTVEIYTCTAFDHSPVQVEVINKLYSENIAFGHCGDDATWVLYEDGSLKISGSGTMYNYSSETPAPWSAYRDEIRTVTLEGVTNVGNDTFVGCKNLESVILHDSVTQIGNTAFRDCIGLDAFEIPSSVRTIGHYAFYGCEALKSINIPEGVKSLGKHSFRKCENLRSVHLPVSVREISDNAFEGCTSLTSSFYNGTQYDWEDVTVGIGNETLTDSLMFVISAGVCGKNVMWALTRNGELIVDGSGAMYDFSDSADVPWAAYTKEIKSITVCDGVDYVGDNAFNGCSEAESLRIPASAKQYNGRSVYDGCTALKTITLTKGNGSMSDFGTDTSLSASVAYYKYAPWNISRCSDIIIEEGVTHIGAFAFSYADYFETINLPQSLKSIGNNAFYSCISLRKLDLPVGIKEVGSYAFYHCTALEPFIIPTGISTIEKAAFRYCDSLDTVYYDGTEYEWSLVSHEEWPKDVNVVFLVNHADENDTITVVYDIPVTCTTQGEKVYYCRCGKTFTDITPALGHNFTGWTVTKEPTCTQDGQKIRSCTACGHTEKEIIPALGMVRSVSLPDITVNYKDTSTLVPKIEADSGVDYTVVYASSDTSVVTVETDGTLTTVSKGSATVTCTVTDEYGNIVTDTSEVTVKYSFGQWLIVIFLFGWIWY